MIEIKAENKGKQTELRIQLSGYGEDLVTEATHIMVQLPKRLKETNMSLFLRFLAELAETDMFGVADRAKEVDDNAEPVEG